MTGRLGVRGTGKKAEGRDYKGALDSIYSDGHAYDLDCGHGSWVVTYNKLYTLMYPVYGMSITSQ